MPESYLQLGATFILAMSLLELVKFLINKITHKHENGLSSEVRLIGNNHLSHILDAIKDQTEGNNSWHKRQTEILIEISTILKERK